MPDTLTPTPVDPEVIRAVAGAGKTFQLVERYVDIVLDQGYSPAQVAVITFTEAAGRELIDRVTEKLAREADTAAGAERRARAREILGALPAAPIGTIHSFARRMLLQQSVAAGVPFGVQVRDSVDPVLHRAMRDHILRRTQALAQSWPIPAELRSRRRSNGAAVFLDTDAAGLLDDVSGTLLRAPEVGAALPRTLIERFAQDAETAWRDLHALAEPRGELLSVDEASVLLSRAAAEYTAQGDCLSGKKADAFQGRAECAGKAREDLFPNRGAAAAPPLKAGRSNTKWLTQAMAGQLSGPGGDRLEAWVERMEKHNAALERRQEQIGKTYARLAGTLAVEAFVTERATSTQWLLQDELLQRGLRLLQNDASAAESLRAQYPLVLLDEAQDIDATQMQLLLFLTQRVGLTVVGDPQQSIYGFRGATYATFDHLQHAVIGDKEPVPLNTTRRCLPVVVDAVNDVCAADPRHQVMEAFRSDEPGRGSVTALLARPQPGPPQPGSSKPTKPKAEDYRIAQADALADEVVAFLDPSAGEGRQVSDSTKDPVTGVKTTTWRTAKPADVAVLVPSRLSVPSIEAALLLRGVSVTVRTSRDIARHPTAEGLAATLLAISDRGDTRSLLHALRSPVFAITDAELTAARIGLGHRLRVGSIPAPGPSAADREDSDAGEGLPDTVRSALVVLTQARGLMRTHGPAAALDLVLDRTAVRAGLVAAHPSDWMSAWSQVRLLRDSVADRHRTTPEPAPAFAAWLAEQLGLAGLTNTSVLDEPAADTVTITTIHQSKGLQWPIVLTAARTSDDEKLKTLSLMDWQVRVHLTTRCSNLESDEGGEPAKAGRPSESARLLYVALTRAQDHLVISGLSDGRKVHRVWCSDNLEESLADTDDPRIRRQSVPVTRGQAPQARPTRLTEPGPSHVGPGDVPARLAAVAESARRIMVRRKPSAWVSGAEHASPDVVPAQHRAGSALRKSEPTAGDEEAAAAEPSDAAATGTFVHQVLESIDLAAFTGPDAGARAATRAAWRRAEALYGTQGIDTERARIMLDRARGSRLLARAADSSTVRRELPIRGHRDEGDSLLLVDGSIDLLLRDPDRRWVLVDYKTDSSGRPESEFVDKYRAQLRVYRDLLGEAGIAVSESWLLRITPDRVSDVRVGG